MKDKEFFTINNDFEVNSGGGVFSIEAIVDFYFSSLRTLRFFNKN